MTAKPKSELMKETRQRRRDAGLVPVTLWVYPGEKDMLLRRYDKRGAVSNLVGMSGSATSMAKDKR